VLEVQDLHRVFGEGENAVHILKGLNFSVKRGEFMLIVGSSGSGKSTLLNQIGLLDRPTSGKVIIDGTDTSILDDNQRSIFRSVKLGFIFQFSNLIADLTVLENVLLPRDIQRTPEGAEDEAKQLLQSVGMENQIYKFANKISGGQAQRVAISRALVNKPAIVLADEPTGNLDSKMALSTVSLLKSLNKKYNQTFIIVTHDRPQFGEVDKVITLIDGEIVHGELEASFA